MNAKTKGQSMFAAILGSAMLLVVLAAALTPNFGTVSAQSRLPIWKLHERRRKFVPMDRTLPGAGGHIGSLDPSDARHLLSAPQTPRGRLFERSGRGRHNGRRLRSSAFHRNDGDRNLWRNRSFLPRSREILRNDSPRASGRGIRRDGSVGRHDQLRGWKRRC